VDNEVQEAIFSQLKDGKTRVQLSAAQLPTVAFESKSSDLYWGFRGTQGLTVTGSGSRKTGRYVGTLSYVIRDSYGFPASDTLHGFGAPMRYLQTACGAPHHPGGAHWFPDTITVTVPFNRPAQMNTPLSAVSGPDLSPYGLHGGCMPVSRSSSTKGPSTAGCSFGVSDMLDHARPGWPTTSSSTRSSREPPR
jgi:hypothetical protein